MDLYKFEDEQAVYKQADKIINSIFADKSYSNPEKISLLIQEYEKKQFKLDSQLSKAIKAEIECIKQAKESVLEANSFMKEADQKTERLAQVWQEQSGFHSFMEDVVTLQTFQNNVGKVVEQLSYFIDMETEMQTLERMAEDESKYQIVANKLLSLIELRDALLEDSSWQQQMAVMRKQFVKVNNFQTKFFDTKIFNCFNDCIKFGKENHETLKIAVQVIEAYDNALLAKGKERQLRDRAIDMIRESIEKKFTEELSDAQDLITVVQNAKFATKDLIDVNDYVQPCFPKEFPIMQLYQVQYQRNIEAKIFPYFDEIEEEKQYGNLVILLGWIDDYESMLSRAGVDSTKLTNLKVKVKILMPFFIDHNRNIVQNYIADALALDTKKFNRKYYEDLLRDGQDLISMFPSDIFRFVNQQADVIKDSLKGEIFVQFVRCITQAINNFQAQERIKLEKEWKESVKNCENQDQIVNFQYKIILYINNYNECLRHAGQSKELFSQCATEEYKSRVEKLFFNEVQRELNQSIPHFINIIIEIIFTKELKEHFPAFFTLKWLNDKSSTIMSNVIKTISVELNDIEEQNLIINIIHHRMVVKESLEFLLNAYIEQLIILVKILYKASNNMEVKYCNYPVTLKKIQQEASNDLKSVFNSKVQFTDAIKRDKMCFFKFADSYGECTSKAFMEKIKNKFAILVDLFMKKNKQFEVLPAKVAEVFPEKASELLEAVLIVRDDVEGRASSIPKRGMGYD